ncbi:MAG: metallophosphoesterase [Bacteroidota bacterium]
MKRSLPFSLFFALSAFISFETNGQTITRGPYLQSPGPNSMVVRWRTDSLTDSRVYYGTTLGSMTLFADSATPTTEHRVKINGLSPRTKYFYSIGSSTQIQRGSDPLMYFTTAPDPSIPTPVRLWAIGDWGHGNIDERDVRNSYLSYTANHPADLQLWLGDNVYQDGTDLEYSTKCFDTINGYGNVFLNMPFAPSPGNHDWNSVCGWQAGCNTPPLQQTGPYLDMVDPPIEGEHGGVASHTKLYYSFDYGDIHFISLNSELGATSSVNDWVGVQSYTNTTTFTSPMIDWLKADLAATTKKWKIAFWHQCPYSGDGDFTELLSFQLFTFAARAHFNPILEQNGVDLILTGHDHNYQRSYLANGLYTFKSGFNSSMLVNGNRTGDGDAGQAYVKYTNGPLAGKGTVYVVEGNSSGSNASAPLNHPLIYWGEQCDSCIGSLIVDIDGDRLDGYYLNAYDSIRDHFTILKQQWTGIDYNKTTDDIFAVYPNPFTGQTEISYTLLKKSGVKVEVLDMSGKLVYSQTQTFREPGKYNDLLKLENLSTGTYTIRFDCDGEIKYSKIVKSE